MLRIHLRHVVAEARIGRRVHFDAYLSEIGNRPGEGHSIKERLGVVETWLDNGNTRLRPNSFRRVEGERGLLPNAVDASDREMN
jgi:hypothetical protein